MIAADGLPLPQRYLAMASLACAITMAVVDSAMLNVALPTIARELGVLPERAIWIVTTYQIAVVTSLLAFAALGDIHGYRRVFTTGLTLFILSSIVCASANSFLALFVARTVQGFACAAIFGVSTALVRFTQPRAQLGRAVSYIALLVAISLAAGPTIGSAIIAVSSWWCIFLFNIPLGVLALAFTKALPHTECSRRPFDWVSALLNAFTSGLLVIGLGIIIERPAWGGSAILASLVVGTTLVRREIRQKTPLLPVDLMRIRAFAVSVSASICSFGAQTCAFVALPFYLQHDLALSEFETGLLLTAWPVAVAVTAPIAGRLADRFNAGVLCSVGAGLLALGLLLIATHPTQGAMAYLVLGTVTAGIGFGSFQTPNNRSMLLAAPLERSGAAGGMQATARQFGQAVASALVALAFAAFRHQTHYALLIGSTLAGIAAGVSLLHVTPRNR